MTKELKVDEVLERAKLGQIEQAREQLKDIAARHPEAAAWCSRVRDNLRRLADDPNDRALRVQTMRNVQSLKSALSSRE